MRIIHIVENLDKGSVENLLLNIFIESKKYRPDWKWTFYCILGRAGRLDETVRNAGGEIIYSPVTVSNKIAFLKNLRKVLKAGRYDIVHSHHDYLSGFYLLASAGIKFRKRVLHIHNTDKSLPVGSRLLQRMLLIPFRKLALHFSDNVVGVSRDALADFIGSGKTTNSKYTVLYHGVDLNRFDRLLNPAQFKKTIRVPADCRIGVFVGRMNDLKNPLFVVDILKNILILRRDVYMVFIGKGDMETEVLAKAKELEIDDHIRILGWHEDVPMVLKCSDVFVFPRKEYPKEALGIVIVEAQAAGLPMFITRGIVDDAIVIEELAHFNNLNDPVDWSRQISSVLDESKQVSREESLEKMRQSPFELGNAAKNFIQFYER